MHHRLEYDGFITICDRDTGECRWCVRIGEFYDTEEYPREQKYETHEPSPSTEKSTEKSTRLRYINRSAQHHTDKTECEGSSDREDDDNWYR